jgi:hypothetical protein
MSAFLAYSESFACVLARHQLSTCLVITVLDAVVARDDGTCVGKESHNAQPRLHDAQSQSSSPWIVMYALSTISPINMDYCLLWLYLWAATQGSNMVSRHWLVLHLYC